MISRVVMSGFHWCRTPPKLASKFRNARNAQEDVSRIIWQSGKAMRQHRGRTKVVRYMVVCGGAHELHGEEGYKAGINETC